jgi:predicted phosphodiesterase
VVAALTAGQESFRVKALISDIHGNLEALQAVLQDIEKHNVQEIYCLGDVVGYGPNPRECVDLVMKCKIVLLGNHDQGAMFDPEGFNPPAERAIFWTRAQLEAPGDNRQAKERRWEFLAERPRSFKENGFLYVHGSARNPLNEYVFPEDIYNQRKMDRIFALVERYCFQGHTHVPGIFTESLPEDLYQFHSPEEVDYIYRLDGRKTLCNVGSVGQPRDGDWRGCYVLLDGETIRFRRVEYDIDTTVRKIYDIPDLDNFLGDRLRDGR